MAFAEGTTTEQGKQPYKYNNKELDDRAGLNWYDYSARMKDDWGFTTQDPLSEKFYNWSPYVYCYNNPMKFIDPDGKDPKNPKHWAQFGKDIWNATKIMFSVGMQAAAEWKSGTSTVGLNLNAGSMDLIGSDNGELAPGKLTPQINQEFEIGVGVVGVGFSKSVKETGNNTSTLEKTVSIGTVLVEQVHTTTIETSKNAKGEYVETKSTSENTTRVPDVGGKIAGLVGVELKVDLNKIWEALGNLINKK